MNTDLTRTLADLTRTLADLVLGPKPAAPRKDPPYDGRHTLDWEGVHLRVPYWIANERELATEMAEITLGPVTEWTVIGVDDSAGGSADAIRDAIAETVDADYRAHQADRDDRGDWDYERRKQERLDRQEDAR